MTPQMPDTPDPWVLLGLEVTSFDRTESGGAPDRVVSFDRKLIEKFESHYDWEFIEKEDGTFQVHFFKCPWRPSKSFLERLPKKEPPE